MAPVTLEAVRQLLPPACTIAFAQTSTKAEQLKLLADADVVMIAGTFIEGDVIRQAPRLTHLAPQMYIAYHQCVVHVAPLS